MGIERRNHEPRTGDRDEQVDLLRAHPGALEACFRRRASQLHRVLDVLLIGFGERARLDGVVDGKQGVALAHLGIVDDAHHGFHAALRDFEHAAHVILHVVARDDVRRQRGGGGHDADIGCW